MAMRSSRGCQERSMWRLGSIAGLVFCISCGGGSGSPASPALPSSPDAISSDSAFFSFVTQTEPFTSYTPFPNLSGNTTDILSGSSAHVPRIRVSMNAKAFGALQNGRIPSGATFPDGSIVFKEVLGNSGAPSVYAVMYKDRGNSLEGNGWLWAEYRTDGGAEYAVTNRGGACTSCHSLGQGPRNDFVRSFERQQ